MKNITIKITNTITLTSTKTRLLLAGLLTLFMLVITFIKTTAFFQPEVSCGWLLYLLCIIGCLLSGAVLTFTYSVSEKLAKRLTTTAIFLLPIGTITMAECLNGVFVGNWHILGWIFNGIFYASLYLLVYALSGSRKVPFLVINPIIYLIAMTNHYVMAYRGTPFLPMDILYAGTAANVFGSYEFSLDYQVILSTVLFVLLLGIAWKIKTTKKKLWEKICKRFVAGALSLFVLVGYFASDTLANIGFTPDFFNQTRGYQKLGVTMNFFMNTKYLTVAEPESYSPDKIEAAMYKVLGSDDTASKNDTNIQTPNIICIMNESLSDLSVLGDVHTNKDYMPFLHSLTENTIKGNLYVPVIGAGTSNTEFEFLTGTSTAFMPSGSNAYTLYVNDRLPTTVNTIKEYGYSATAFHPFYKINWNRVNAYNYIGFDKYFGMESLFDEKTMDMMKSGATSKELAEQIAKRYPNEDVLTRLYVNDSFNYKKIIEMYEQKDHDTPFYMFNVTMQNHGGYETKFSNFEEEIYLVDGNGKARTKYPSTNQYLSLVYESDKSFEKLVEYFNDQDEPTIICMFGDHQPNVEDGFIEETLGVDSIYNLNFEQTLARYCTPFYIWANYDIEEKEIDMLSVNYLSSYLMDVIGMGMPLFNQYLLKLSETLPVINTVGYIDAEGNSYPYTAKTKYTELIEDYENVCYNYLFDEKNRCDWLYSLE